MDSDMDNVHSVTGNRSTHYGQFPSEVRITENPFKYSVGTRVRDNIFLDMLKPKTGDRILDAACGLGYFTDLFARHGALAIGVDLDKLCIDYCQKHMQGDYHIIDLTQIPYPYPDTYFDKVVCSEVLEHILNNGIVLDEIRRILKPKGTLVASTPCSEGIFGSLLKNIGHNHINRNSREYHHYKGFTKESLSGLLMQHGFKATKVEYTMVAGVEVFMSMTKILVHLTQKKAIDSQSNALNMNRGLLWKVYKRLFPLVMLEARLEQPLSRLLKGHMIIIKAVKA